VEKLIKFWSFGLNLTILRAIYALFLQHIECLEGSYLRVKQKIVPPQAKLFDETIKKNS